MIFKYLKKNTLFNEIINLNLKEFDNNKYNTNKIILVEFNSFHITHIIFSYIANFFKKKK